jgi:hypothetical protein
MSKTINFDTVRKIGLRLPSVEESRSYGVSSLKIRGKLFACPAINKSAEPGSLVVRISFDDRAELIAADPDTYYITDHYVNYPSVLVRLSRISQEALADLLLMGWRFVTKETARRGRPLLKSRKKGVASGKR